MKARCSAIILTKLRKSISTCIWTFLYIELLLEEAGRPIHIKKMHYADFENQITKKYALVVERWPLDLFVSPHQLSTMAELTVLYNAWTADVTKFRKLTPVEHHNWLKVYNAKLAANPREMVTLRSDREDAPRTAPLVTAQMIGDGSAGPSSQGVENQEAAPVIPSITTSTTNDPVMKPRGRKRKNPQETVFAVGGEAPPKQRARRSDYGKTHARCVNKTADSEVVGSEATGSEASAPKKRRGRPRKATQDATSMEL